MGRTNSDYLRIDSDIVRSVIARETTFSDYLEDTVERLENGDHSASWDFSGWYDTLDDLGVIGLEHELCVDCFTYYQTYNPKLMKGSAIANGAVSGVSVIASVVGTVIKKKNPLLGKVLQKMGYSGLLVCGGGHVYYALTGKSLAEDVEPHMEFLRETAADLDEEVARLFP